MNLHIHVTPLGIAAIAAAWLLIACAIATIPHRFRRATPEPTPLEDLGEFIEIQRGLPPVPTPSRYLPVDCLSDDDTEMHQRFWDLVDSTDWFVQ